jgi:hypothetical protein
LLIGSKKMLVHRGLAGSRDTAFRAEREDKPVGGHVSVYLGSFSPEEMAEACQSKKGLGQILQDLLDAALKRLVTDLV